MSTHQSSPLRDETKQACISCPQSQVSSLFSPDASQLLSPTLLSPPPPSPNTSSQSPAPRCKSIPLLCPTPFSPHFSTEPSLLLCSNISEITKAKKHQNLDWLRFQSNKKRFRFGKVTKSNQYSGVFESSLTSLWAWDHESSSKHQDRFWCWRRGREDKIEPCRMRRPLCHPT